MGISYYKEYDKVFEWKYQAKDFIEQLKAKSKKAGLKVAIQLLPHVRSTSSRTHSESRIVAYTVRWFYKPPKGGKRQ